MNIVFYKTNQTPEEYANEDLLQAKGMTVEAQDIPQGDDGVLKKYKGDKRAKINSDLKYKYISTYKKSGEYLIIIESTIKNPEFTDEVERVFDGVVKSIEVPASDDDNQESPGQQIIEETGKIIENITESLEIPINN